MVFMPDYIIANRGNQIFLSVMDLLLCLCLGKYCETKCDIGVNAIRKVPAKRYKELTGRIQCVF